MNTDFKCNSKRSRDSLEAQSLQTNGSFESRKVVVRDPQDEEQVCHIDLPLALHIERNEFLNKTLSFSRCTKFILSRGTNITNEAMVIFLSGRTLLHTIELSHCPHISDHTLWALRTNCARIRTVSIINCPITDEGLVALCSYRTNIQELQIGACKKLTDRSLHQIARSLTQLATFSMANNTQFTLDGFKSIIYNCRNLETIDLWKCTQVTPEWIDVLTILGDHIKNINIGGCPQVALFDDCVDMD